MKTNQIRQKFLDFFSNKNHFIQNSSSLIPHNDKTLLFVNAGMVPFKDIFSGIKKYNYNRVASSQRCVRAGGKHNDLENVGYTARHHTFFEMLGNFSFGDYFKEEAIGYAWEFLTKELNIPAEKLWISVYEEDLEAEEIWIKKIGFPKNRISRCGAKDNFWQMGDTGPCGPCSEIFYDHGQHITGGPPGHADADSDRFVEIWNLVFTQFDRQKDGYLKPLNKPCVDTGMGLERLAAVMQNKNNNYDIDIFVVIAKELLKFIPKINKIKINNISIRVIIDHIRSVSFLIADGVIPSNDGRGYVLRRIIRRAIRHGLKLGIKGNFFYLLVPILAKQNKDIYPVLQQKLAMIETTIKAEEKLFSQTLIDGINILTKTITQLTNKIIPGEIAFKLYDTYGFPLDLTIDIAKEKGLTVNINAFNDAMNLQKQLAKKASNFNADNNLIINNITKFKGYDNLIIKANIISIIKDNIIISNLNMDNNAIIILDKTVFYAEAGGQVGDSGEIIIDDSVFKVTDTKIQKSGAIEHYGKLIKGKLNINDRVTLKVDHDRRLNIMRNHSATHLLHASLKEVLGENVAQKGSLVDKLKLRFDFSYNKAISNDDLDKIEAIVNEKILENSTVYTEISDINSAVSKGAVALFDEKYNDKVRVLTMGYNNFSIELCGGTHVNQLGDIGAFRIVDESAVASGVRRIEAVTANAAYKFDKNIQRDLNYIKYLTKTDNVIEKIKQLSQQHKELEQKITNLQNKVIGFVANDIIIKTKKINNIYVVNAIVKDINIKGLRSLVDLLKNKLITVIIVLASVDNNKISLIAGVSKNLTNKHHAGNILSSIATKIDGKGGGRADMAQGGGTNIQKLPEALASLVDLIKQ